VNGPRFAATKTLGECFDGALATLIRLREINLSERVRCTHIYDPLTMMGKDEKCRN
jgi:hypothetical protein